MIQSKLILGQITLEDLGIDLKNIRRKLSIQVRHTYVQVKQWLSAPVTNEFSPDQQVEGFLQAIRHLCEVENFEATIQILKAQLENSASEIPSLPLYSYLLYKGLGEQLRETTETILAKFQGQEADKCFIQILQAKAYESLGKQGQAVALYKNICSNRPEQSVEYLEAFCRLVVCQVQIGNYKDGMPNLESALTQVTAFNRSAASPNLTEVEIDLLENKAIYKMVAGDFDEAFSFFQEVFDLRRSNQIVTSRVRPLVHQGIVLRKSAASSSYLMKLLFVNSLRLLKLNGLADALYSHFCLPMLPIIQQKYDSAETLLSQAYTLYEGLEDEASVGWVSHHLGWVKLNRGEAALSEGYARVAIEQYERDGNQRGISDCHEQLGRIYLAMGNQYIEEAEYHFNHSLSIRESIGNLHGAASSTLNFAFLYWHKKDYLQSYQNLLEGIQGYYRIRLLNLKRMIGILTLFSVWTVGNRDWTM